MFIKINFYEGEAKRVLFVSVCVKDILSHLTKVNAVVVVSANVCFAPKFFAHAQDMILSGTHI
jgi:hypothetical protein